MVGIAEEVLIALVLRKPIFVLGGSGRFWAVQAARRKPSVRYLAPTGLRWALSGA